MMGRQYTGGGVGSRKHGKGGTPGHNADMIQTSRELNARADEQRRLRQRQKGRLYGSVRDLFRSERRGQQ